ncbi:MAG: hypothetical protein ACK4Z6_00555 [Candidatus Methylomirabilales bacterium]
MTKRIKTLVIGMVGLFALLLWAGPSLAGSRVTVKMGALSPEKVTIAKGEEVIWVNATGSLIHIEFATQPGGHLFQVPKNEAFRVRFEEPGEHKYVVHVHGGKPGILSGAVVVK